MYDCWNSIIILVVIPTLWGDDEILHLPWDFSEAKWGGMLVNCGVVELRVYSIDLDFLWLSLAFLGIMKLTFTKWKKFGNSNQHQYYSGANRSLKYLESLAKILGISTQVNFLSHFNTTQCFDSTVNRFLRAFIPYTFSMKINLIAQTREDGKSLVFIHEPPSMHTVKFLHRARAWTHPMWVQLKIGKGILRKQLNSVF